ncbi:peptidyl-prolyl cis-trans isomerase [Deinococcus sp.]|uniref:peptidylprolyl isomerase n=1 Tax=Deinococcus sp. TaxID=47478 RepID=UPI0025C39B5D|nr:peptidyl-prolyl cis-trans isomerase [Deinococcus sp.]
MSRKPVQTALMGLLAALMIGGSAAYVYQQRGSGGLTGPQGTPAIKVNGSTISAEELATLRQSNPVLGITTGVLGDDFKTVVAARAVQNELYKQGSKDIEVSRADVDAQVKKTREEAKLTDNKAWTDALQRVGLSDSLYRQQVHDGLQIQRKVDALKAAAPAATEAEAKAYFGLNRDQYQTEAQIVGREIVVTDKAKADDLLKQLKGGADFARLAGEHSTENKDRGGALGPLENGAPKPVSRVVIPTDVAAAAFALTGGGLTDVIASGGKFYIVKVEKYLPPTPKTFDEAKSDVMTAVSNQKKDQALEAWSDGLQKGAKIEYVSPDWQVVDPVVASVAGQNIKYSELVAQVVGNQQVAMMLQQMPPEQISGMLNTGFKPQIVEQLLTGYAAPTVAKNLGLNLVGNRQEMAATLGAYGARDVKVTGADVQKAYQENIKQFQTPPSATVDEASFKDRNQAAAFQADWNGSGDFTVAATKAGATVSERGTVTTATPQAPSKLDPKVEAAVFAAPLRSVGEGSLSAVVPVGKRFSVAYVRDLKKAETKPLNEVRTQLESQVLSTKKSTAAQEFLKTEVAKLKPVDNLKTVLADQAKRVAAAEKAAAPAAGTGTTGTGTTDTGTTGTGAGGASGSATTSPTTSPTTPSGGSTK